MNTVTIHAVPTRIPQAATEGFKLVDSSGVLHEDGTPKTEPTTYETAGAALTAGQTRFAVGEMYNGQRISAISVLDDRLELTLGE